MNTSRKLLILAVPFLAGCFSLTPDKLSRDRFNPEVPGFSKRNIAPDVYQVMYVGYRHAAWDAVRRVFAVRLHRLCSGEYDYTDMRELISVSDADIEGGPFIKATVACANVKAAQVGHHSAR